MQWCSLSHETLLNRQMEHRLLVWFNPDHQKGDRHYWGTCAYFPPLSHFTRALENARKIMPEETLGGAQVRGFRKKITMNNKQKLFRINS